MKNNEKNNFIIEVRTKWEKDNNSYTRKVIEYTCPCIFEEVDEAIYTKFLSPTKVYEELCTYISSNEIEIKAITKDSKEEIVEPSNLIKTLLKFTKYQWLKGE